MLWLRDGMLLINGDGHLIDCEECPCVSDNHESPCNDPDPVPGTLDCSLTFDGNTINVSLTWIEESSACSGFEGWEYTGGNVEICPGLELAGNGIALCCDGAWTLQVAVYVSGILQAFTTGGSGLDALTINDTNPIDYETQTSAPFSACSVLEDLYITIATPP